ncbi:MAG: hypothetical protein NTX71_12605 [Candidatus Aureabacteria bacterium]|nr:hypothetical protein [Candidatus Auribacterota bacterium]
MKRLVSVALLIALVVMVASVAMADDRVKVKSKYYTPYGKVKEYRYPYHYYYPYYPPPSGYYYPPTYYYDPYNPSYPPPAYYPPYPYYGRYKVKIED